MKNNQPGHPLLRERAFTLGELLIAVAIIAILAALFFPAINRAISFSRQVKSAGNLRAMGPALMAYANDHNGALIAGAINTDAMSTPFWFNTLGPYMGSPEDATPAGAARKVRPAWQNDPAKVFNDPPVYNGKACSGVGYGWNHAYFGYLPYEPYRTANGWRSNLKQVDQPAQTIIIGTSPDDPNSKDVLQHVVLHPGNAGTVRFGGKGLFLFLDGHVEALTPTETAANNNYLFLKKKPATVNP